MSIIDRLRLWWQERTGEEETPFDGDAPAWFISVVVHLAVLLVFSVLVLHTTSNQITLTVQSVDVPEEEELPEEFFFSKNPTEAIGANSVQGVDAAMAVAPNFSEISDVSFEIERPDEQAIVEVDQSLDLPTGPQAMENLAVKGAAGVGTTGAEGAIDRITHEIILSLEQRKTLVVWLFDQSGSLRPQREGINERFERIYKELGVIRDSGEEAFAKHGNDALLSSVVAFGGQVNFVVEKPTTDVAAIQEAVANIPDDPSGVEMTFTAIGMAVDKYKDYRLGRYAGGARNVMIVVFTDEVGDDGPRLEPCLAICKRYGVPVYVVGVPAPFGRKDAPVKYVDPDPQYDQSVQWIPVAQGPESLRPERLKLFLPGVRGRDDELEYLDSGFGPWALTRLCYETGGIYFAVHANRNAAQQFVNRNETAVMAAPISRFFDPAVMRSYRPDYVSEQEYLKALAENKAKAALVAAAEMSWLSPMEAPQTRFVMVDEGRAKNQMTEAQKAAARLEPKLLELYTVLKAGEADRAKLIAPRWQAGYDLALGSVAAARARAEGYNIVLAKLKNGRRFENKDNNTWELQPSNENIEGGSQIEKLAAEAQKYLQRVVEEHPGTPWALLAEHDLKTPMGWSIVESYTDVPRPGMGMGNGNNNNNNNNNPPLRINRPLPRRPNLKL